MVSAGGAFKQRVFNLCTLVIEDITEIQPHSDFSRRDLAEWKLFSASHCSLFLVWLGK